jgi:hypothetical protein
MSKDACTRCGFESKHRRNYWWDRHPVAAALFALPAGYTLVAVMLVYPWFTIPATIIVCALLLNRAARRRAAVAARADWDYRQQIVRAVKAAPAAAQPESEPHDSGSRTVRARRHVLTDWPTTPMLTRPIRTRR